MMKKVYTTGEVAKLLGININTVIKWFDEGKINGFRLPGSLERRITRTALLHFMQTNEIPMELLGEPVQGPDRRSMPRYATDIPVHFTMSDESCEASITNISESGALVAVPESCANKFRYSDFGLELSFLGDPLNGLTTKAHVANVRNMDDYIGLGLRFEPANKQLQTKIRNAFA